MEILEALRHALAKYQPAIYPGHLSIIIRIRMMGDPEDDILVSLYPSGCDLIIWTSLPDNMTKEVFSLADPDLIPKLKSLLDDLKTA